MRSIPFFGDFFSSDFGLDFFSFFFSAEISGLEMVDFPVADMMKAEERRGARATAGGKGEGGAVGGGGAGAAEEEEFGVLESWREKIEDFFGSQGFWSCCDA